MGLSCSRRFVLPARRVQQDEHEAPVTETDDGRRDGQVQHLGGSSEETCAVCLESLETSASQALACDHTFHASCISDFLRLGSSDRCPLCQRPDPDLRPLQALVMDMLLAYKTQSLAPADHPDRNRSHCIKSAERVLELVPEHPAALFVSGKCLATGMGISKDLGRARELFEKVCECGAPREIAESMTALGHLCEQEGKLSEARQLFEEAYRNGDTLAANWLGAHYLKEGRHREAKELFEAGCQHGDACAFVNLGDIYRAEGHTGKARELYEEGCLRGAGRASLRLGQMCDEEGKTEEAYTYLEEARQRGDPLGALNLGVLCAHQSRYAEAKEFYIEAYHGKDRGAAMSAASNLGSLYMVEERVDEARLLFEEAHQEGEPMALPLLARLFYIEGHKHSRAGRFTEAREFLEKSRHLCAQSTADAAGVAPKAGDVALVLGDVYFQLGQQSKECELSGPLSRQAMGLWEEAVREGTAEAANQLYCARLRVGTQAPKLKGDMVMAYGLKSVAGASLNGRVGIVITDDAGEGRFGVKFNDETVVSLRGDNLSKPPPSVPRDGKCKPSDLLRKIA